MSFIDKNTMQKNKVINKNNGMRNVIYENANNIEFLLKEFYNEQRRINNKSKKNINENYLNSALLEDLPLKQQIELYKECIRELNKETPEIKSNRIEIENINKKISELKSNIYNEKQINKSLDKINNNYIKILNNIKLDNSLLRQNEKENILKSLNNDYQNLKEEYKSSQHILKKQINSIIILEDNCRFIGENIAYYKNIMENANDENEDNIDFEEIKKKADEVENLKNSLESKYLYKIKKQREKIKKLKEFNDILAETILEKSKEIKLDMINKNKTVKFTSEKNKEKDNSESSPYSKINYAMTFKNDAMLRDDNSVEEKNNLIKKTTKELNIKNN